MACWDATAVKVGTGEYLNREAAEERRIYPFFPEFNYAEVPAPA